MITKPPKIEISDEGFQFTSDEAPGAFPNGTRVAKINSQPGDARPDGSRATVIGSIGPIPHPLTGRTTYGYFVSSPSIPHPVFITGDRIELVKNEN